MSPAHNPHQQSSQNDSQCSELQTERRMHVDQNYSEVYKMFNVYNFASAVFPKIWGFILKKWLPIYDSKYCPSIATTFYHLSGNCWIPSQKNDASFEAIHESIHFLTSLLHFLQNDRFHKCVSLENQNTLLRGKRFRDYKWHSLDTSCVKKNDTRQLWNVTYWLLKTLLSAGPSFIWSGLNS